MPLPKAPTLRPSRPASRQSGNKTGSLLLMLGLLFAFLGLSALLLPLLITLPEMRDFLGSVAIAGWVMLALGGGLIGLSVRWRLKNPA